MRKINLSINLGNRTFYTLIAILVIAGIGGIAYAIGSVPNPGHAISELQACLSGETLVSNGAGWECQEVSTSGCEVLSPANPSEEAGTAYRIINVPDYCKNGNYCMIILKDTAVGDTYLMRKVYQQRNDNKWSSEMGGGGTTAYVGTNGNSVQSGILVYSTGLYDDYPGQETDPDKWTYADTSTYYGEIVACRI